MSVVARRRSNPVAEMMNWFDESNFGLRGLGMVPEIRVEDFVDDGTYVIRAEIPGIDPEKDLDVHLEGERLVVRGERREEKKEKNRHELHYGSFYRSLPLPTGARAEDISATYTDGVLELRLPYDGEAEAPRQIPVRRGGE